MIARIHIRDDHPADRRSTEPRRSRPRASTCGLNPHRPSCRPKSRIKIGLALSCGAAKGLSHIGVIQALEAQGIHIDAIAGSSMGAYIAAIWGFGHNGQRMEELACELEGRWGLWKLMDPVFPPRRGFLLGSKAIDRLRLTIGSLHFSDMVRPATIVATDWSTLERHVFTQGEVAEAVHASVAIPGVCVPVRINGRLYMDGGIADPLPVDVLREMGMDKVIAVNTIPTPPIMRCCEEQEREKAALVGRQSGFLRCIHKHLNAFARGNILDTMMRAVHGAQLRVAEAACARADLVIRPLALDSSWIEFNKPRKYIEIGRRAAEDQMEAIHALLKERTTPHENHEPSLALGST